MAGVSCGHVLQNCILGGDMKEPRKVLRQFCVMLADDMLRKIDEEIRHRQGVSKGHWIREAIYEKFQRRKK